MKIILHNMTALNCFIDGSRFFEGDIDVKQKHHLINGRSYLGMCSLDLNKPIEVTINTDREDVRTDFYNFLRKWSVNEG